MRIDKLSKDTNISRVFMLVYGRSGCGKTTSLINLPWDRVVYITTEAGFRVIQGLLSLVEYLYEEAQKTSIDEAFEVFKQERPTASIEQVAILRNAVEMRNLKPKDWKLEIDWIIVDCMADLYSTTIWNAYQEKSILSGIDMSKKDIIVIDTITYFSDIVIRERSAANKNNSNKFATWSEHSIAIKTMLDNLVMLRGIKIVIGHEGYDKELKKRTLAIQGDAVKADIAGRFNVVLYATDWTEQVSGEDKTRRVFVTNQDLLTDKADCKTQDPRIADIEPMDLSIVLAKLGVK